MVILSVLLVVLSIAAQQTAAQWNIGNVGAQGNGMLPMNGGLQSNGMMPMNAGMQGNGMMPMNGGMQSNGMLPMNGAMQTNPMMANNGFQQNAMLPGAGFQANPMMANRGFQPNGMMGAAAAFPSNPLMANRGFAQNAGGFQNPVQGMMGNAQSLMGNAQITQTPQFLTCIGRNTNGDEIRTSFYYEQPKNTRQQNPWNPWRTMTAQPRRMRMFSLISTNINSQLQGEFQHVITEYSRVEDGCMSQALGDILTDKSWWGQSRVRGIVGTRTTVYQGQSARSTEVIDDLQMNELVGRGLALCPVNQLMGSTCRDLIPLCCKIGMDQAPVTPQNSQRMNRGQGQLGQFGMQSVPNAGLPAQQTGGLNNGLNMNGGNLNLAG